MLAINNTRKDVKIKIKVTEALTCLEKPTLILAQSFIGHVVSLPIKNKVISVSSSDIVKARSPAMIRDSFIFGRRTYQNA